MAQLLDLEILKLIENSSNINVLKKSINDKISDIKITENENLLLLANKFKTNNFNLSKLESECKSIIIDKKQKKLLVYLYNSILYNDDAKQFLLNNDINSDKFEKKIYKSYEGTTIMVYYHNNKWNISTRNCLNAENSKWNKNKSYLNIFNECISDFPSSKFYNSLNKEYYYFFLVVHHENKNIIDYEYLFGSKYKKLIHILTRKNSDHTEVDIKDPSNFSNKLNIIVPEETDNYDYILNLNNQNKIKLPILDEGIIIKLINKETKNTEILKLQSNGYYLINKLKPNYNNLLKTFIDLYKQELLKEHLMYFPNNRNIKLKINSVVSEYDIIGIIDGIFKVLTSEMFELFKLLYDLKNCSHKNNVLYDKLPTQFKVILYKIRGVYFEKKEQLSKLKNENNNEVIVYKNYNLKLIDIYNLLKNYDIDDFFNLLKARDTLLNIKEVGDVISNKCDINLLNMCNVYLENLNEK